LAQARIQSLLVAVVLVRQVRLRSAILRRPSELTSFKERRVARQVRCLKQPRVVAVEVRLAGLGLGRLVRPKCQVWLVVLVAVARELLILMGLVGQAHQDKEATVGREMVLVLRGLVAVEVRRPLTVHQQ